MGKLYACIYTSEDRKQLVFHASVIARKGSDLTIGTSQPLLRGQQIYLAPVPTGWDGEPIDSQYVRDHERVIIATVSWAENRGRYRLTCMSEQEIRAYTSICRGFIRDEGFELDTTENDGVTTVSIKGRVGFGSAGKMKAVIDRVLAGGAPVIIDMRETDELSSLGLATLTGVLREVRRAKAHIALLVETQSRIMRTLTQTRIGELVKIYSKPELAENVLRRLAEISS